MTIRFSDLQVILPRSTQGAHLQPSSGAAAAVQQQNASAANAAVEHKQRMVNAGSSVDSNVRISEQKRRKKQTYDRGGGRSSKKEDSQDNAGSEQVSPSGQKVLGKPGEVGGNIDIRV